MISITILDVFEFDIKGLLHHLPATYNVLFVSLKAQQYNDVEETGKQEEPKALVTLDGDGVDWTGHAEDEQENFALMAYSNSGSNTEDDPQKALKNKGIVDSGCSST
ncbi:hypothetical protein Tco_0854036 [Tanacetum coccineum]